LRGLVGGAECVGGGARPALMEDAGGPRLGRGEGREGGGIRPVLMDGVVGARRGGRGLARCAELRAGKEGGGRLSISISSSLSSSVESGLEDLGGDGARLNDGIAGGGSFEARLVEARGVVGEDIFLNGGGGIALRSSSAFVGAPLRFMSPDPSPIRSGISTLGWAVSPDD
jgi:hypothetical protein